MTQSSLERTFLYYWNILGDGSEPVEQYRFDCRPKPRKWAFDFAWPDCKTAVECEGIISSKSRHTTITGYAGDCDKYNQAVLQGWIVLRFTVLHLENDPMKAINLVVEALQIRRKESA